MPVQEPGPAPLPGDAACPFCGTAAFGRVQAREMMFGLRERFDYLECRGCGCLRIAAVPADLGRHYPAGYYAHADVAPRGLRGAVARLRRALLPRLLPRLPTLRRRWLRRRPALAAYADRLPDPAARILDVGCGDGKLLRRLRELGYRNAEGVDPFVAADIRLDGSLLVRKAELRDLAGPYDAISLHHALEHMPDQQAALAEVFRLLRPDGFALIRVPIVGGRAWRSYREDWVQLDAPRHLWLHSERSLAALARGAGFEVERITHDSTALQFWGSELYRRDIPLTDPRSPARGGDLFTPAEMAAFASQAEEANLRGEGDQVVAILRRPAGA